MLADPFMLGCHCWNNSQHSHHMKLSDETKLVVISSQLFLIGMGVRLSLGQQFPDFAVFEKKLLFTE